MEIAKNRHCSLLYRQRLAGLVNFAVPILKLPLNLVHLCFKHPNKMYRFRNLFHSNPVPFYTILDRSVVFVDATPVYIGMWDHTGRRSHVFRCNLPILEAEYAAAWVAHILFPGALLFTDNQAVIHLFSRGKLPVGLEGFVCKNGIINPELPFSSSDLHKHGPQPGG